jgi:flavocytochrome c
VTLTVEFSATEIVSINVESEETETIGVSAMDTLTEQVLGNQSVAVDTVSGATLSTAAYIECLNSCVEQAGGNTALLGGEIAAEAVSYQTEADVIVVGAGGAGLMAALTAANDGASVILLEKSSSIGGNTLCAANGINAYDSDVQLADETYQASDTSVEEFEALQTNELSRINLVDAFINNSAEAINYLSGLGVDFTVEISQDDRNSDSNYYLLKSEADGTTTMTSIISALSSALDESGVVLYKNTEATSLVQDENGTVTGVNATGENGEALTFSGKSVVLCTGGFGKNNELIAQVAPEYANCITDELAPTTGDGLVMATEIGAEAVDLDQIQTFPAVISGYGMILPPNLPGGFGLNGTIYVNNAGERFAAESFEIPDAILAQDNGEVYAVFTEENLNDTMRELMNIGYVVSADSAEDLASQLGIDAAGLAAAIETWNADAAATGTDSAFGRENITPLEGTLYGYKFGVGAHYFMGGILIDENTHVLNTDGNVIDGLYAAGEVTGGFHGSQRVDGSGTGDSIVFGMVAGHSAAAAAK